MTARLRTVRVCLLAASISLPLLSAARAAPAAPGPQVELVWVGPDRPVDTRFGHILLRVVDRAAGRDDAYDFGVAPFHRPGFMWAAVHGRAHFKLRRSPAQVRFGSYWMADRQVEALRLDLTAEQTDRLVERLAWNLLPENVEYLYDHVVDNCSTRLRDLLDDVSGGALRDAAPRVALAGRIRDDVLEAGSGYLPTLIGLDLVAGARADDSVGAWERAFLPRNLRDLTAAARNPATGRPLVSAVEVVHERKAPPAIGGGLDVGRRLVLVAVGTLGLFFAMCGVRLRRGEAPLLGRLVGLLLLPLALGSGVVGVPLVSMQLFGDGFIWSANENALLLVPFDVVGLVPAIHWARTGRPRLARWMRLYLDLRLLGVAGLVVGKLAGLLPQDNASFVLAATLVLVGLRAQPSARRQS